MPVAQFAGDRGWGYDGVLPYAPHPGYGTPDDLRALVRAAHDRGLMVLLDVVYNHFGPEGSVPARLCGRLLRRGAAHPVGRRHRVRETPVRRYFIENAIYWLAEFGFDGLRLDAIDHIRDRSEPDIVLELAHEVRARLPGPAGPHCDRGQPQRHLPARARRGPGDALTPPNGTTTSTTSPTSSPPARPRAITATSPRRNGSCWAAAWRKASLSRGNRPATGCRAVSRPAICRPAPSSISCRTTIRSATAPLATVSARSPPAR